MFKYIHRLRTINMRIKNRLQWFSLSVFLLIFVSGSFIFQRNNEEFEKTTHKSIPGALSVAATRRVTKSLAQLGRMDEINNHLLFLNQVPKCGSEILILLLQKLQGFNNYRHVRLKQGNRRHLSNLQQESLVYEIYDLMKREAVPLSLDRHVFFVNFTLFDKQFPTYINLVRHPVDKILSRSVDKNFQDNYFTKCLRTKKYDCNFKGGPPYDLSIPYFCGHDPRCMISNSHWALQEAKRNVVKYYPVVGVLEELNATLEILEHKIPYFFRGVQKVYEKYLLHFQNNNKKVKAPEEVIYKLENILVNEMDFYEWIKSRLFKQLQILYGDHNQH